CVKPAVAIGDYRGVILMLVAALLPVDGIEEAVDHHVAARDAELGEKTLDSVPGDADENPPGDVFQRRGVLPHDEHTRAAVQPTAVEDRPPFDAEGLRRICLGAGVVPG